MSPSTPNPCLQARPSHSISRTSATATKAPEVPASWTQNRAAHLLSGIVMIASAVATSASLTDIDMNGGFQSTRVQLAARWGLQSPDVGSSQESNRAVAETQLAMDVQDNHDQQLQPRVPESDTATM